MAIVSALAGLRYDPARAGEMGTLIAPPYDVISPAEQEELYARSPYNAIRLILPREADRGAAAAAALADWTAREILVRDREPGLYLYSQQFTLPDGSRRRRDGVMCRLRLEDFASGVVRPHERTFAGPKADRMAIMRATATNLSPIFALYARPGKPIRDLLGDAIGAPLVDVDGRHQLWRTTDPATIARFVAALAPETLYIADGHHRYETALAYRDQHPDNDEARWVLAYLANMEEEGVVILPTHRLVRGPLALTADALEARLREGFTVEPLPKERARRDDEIDCVLPDRRLRLRATPAAIARLADLHPAVRALEVAQLHGAVLGPLLGVSSEALSYTHDDAEALDAVGSGRAAAAFLLNPPSIAEVRAVCQAGELMPEKSTYFFPKLGTGLVLSPLR